LLTRSPTKFFSLLSKQQFASMGKLPQKRGLLNIENFKKFVKG